MKFRAVSVKKSEEAVRATIGKTTQLSIAKGLCFN
jgi:hypothetical protein